MNYKEKLFRLRDIVNSHILDFTAHDSTIKATENSFVIPATTELLHFESNDKTFDKIFSFKAESQKDFDRSYFHYKSFDIAYKFIEGEYITASALQNFSGLTDDIKEYEHFFEVTKIPYNKSFIDKQKDSFHIFCLTEDNKTERFWKDYVQDHKGLCLEFNFKNKQHLWHTFELRKVCYDEGSDFTFYSSMQDEIFSTFGRYLNTPGLSKFGALYKRKAKFDWEKETRLLFNLELYQSEYLKCSFSSFPIGSRKFLKIPFDNDLFSLELNSITIGKNLDPMQKEKIQKLADKKGIKTHYDK